VSNLKAGSEPLGPSGVQKGELVGEKSITLSLLAPKRLKRRRKEASIRILRIVGKRNAAIYGDRLSLRKARKNARERGRSEKELVNETLFAVPERNDWDWEDRFTFS